MEGELSVIVGGPSSVIDAVGERVTNAHTVLPDGNVLRCPAGARRRATALGSCVWTLRKMPPLPLASAGIENAAVSDPVVNIPEAPGGIAVLDVGVLCGLAEVLGGALAISGVPLPPPQTGKGRDKKRKRARGHAGGYRATREKMVWNASGSRLVHAAIRSMDGGVRSSGSNRTM